MFDQMYQPLLLLVTLTITMCLWMLVWHRVKFNSKQNNSSMGDFTAKVSLLCSLVTLTTALVHLSRVLEAYDVVPLVAILPLRYCT